MFRVYFLRKKSSYISISTAIISTIQRNMTVSSQFTILYGSQTGQAQAIAEEIHEKSTQRGLESKLYCLSQTEKKFNLENEPLVVLVVSTTGEGDPPDTMQKFMRRLKKKTLPVDHLKLCQYALLALGDTNYTNFCNNGKTLDRRLQALGASHFYDTGLADDAVGLELVVDQWIEGLLDTIQTDFGVKIFQDKKSNNESVDATCNSLEASSEDTSILNVNGECHNSGEKNGNNSDEINIETTSDTTSLNQGQGTLRKSILPLSTSALSVPLVSPHYLEIEFDDCKKEEEPAKGETLVQSRPSFSMATIVSAKHLTSADALKSALNIELDITGCGLDYEPGDSFDLVCSNSEKEVSDLIDILGLKTKEDIPFKVNVMSSTTKKIATKPSYIPNGCSIKNAFLHCLEIRAVPKKALIRTLVEYTEDPNEKRRLQELCSKQGSNDYHTYIRQPNTSLLELMNAFPTCKPHFERLLEHLPQLSPRPYSVASSPLANPNRLNFVFNIVEFTPFEDVRSNRQGVCTGWLNRATKTIECRNKQYDSGLVNGMSEMNLNEQPHINVPVSTRRKTEFKLPTDLKIPIIMVGPGTGVAPFIGFLEHRKLQCESQDRDQDPRHLLGQMWLFYGCRNKDKDFLYQQELQSYHSSGILTHLNVSFSREGTESSPRYVQDNLKLHAAELGKLLFNESAVVFVCGDAKNMAKDVFSTFCDIVGQHQQIDKVDAIKEMSKLRANKQYHEDVWT